MTSACPPLSDLLHQLSAPPSLTRDRAKRRLHPERVDLVLARIGARDCSACTYDRYFAYSMGICTAVASAVMAVGVYAGGVSAMVAADQTYTYYCTGLWGAAIGALSDICLDAMKIKTRMLQNLVGYAKWAAVGTATGGNTLVLATQKFQNIVQRMADTLRSMQGVPTCCIDA